MHLGDKTKIARRHGLHLALAARNTAADLVSDLFASRQHLRRIFTPSNYGGTEEEGK